MDEWKSGNEIISKAADTLTELLKAVEIVIQQENKKVEDMKKTIAFIKERK